MDANQKPQALHGTTSSNLPAGSSSTAQALPSDLPSPASVSPALARSASVEQVSSQGPLLKTESQVSIKELEIQDANNYEKSLSFKQTASAWLPSIMWCIVFAVTIIGQSYDLSLAANFFSFPQYRNLFGESHNGGAKEIPTQWQSIIQVTGQAGQVVAMYFAGKAADKYGYRKTMMVSLASTVVFLFVSFFAADTMLASQNHHVGLAIVALGQLLLGLPWGAFQACVGAYVSDISPTKIRPIMAGYISLCWIFGQLLSTGVITGLRSVEDLTWAYRIPVMFTWIWPPLLLISLFFAPESPAWLVRQKRDADARVALRKLNRDNAFPVDSHLKLIKFANEKAKQASATPDDSVAPADGSDGANQADEPTYGDCFKNTNWRRTRIVVMTSIAQQLCGSALMFHSAKMYQKAGMDVPLSFNLTLAQYGLGIVCILVSFWLMSRYRHRIMWLWGVLGAVVTMGLIGGLGFAPAELKAVPWVIASLLVFFTGVYNLSLGPLVYALTANIPSERLRNKTGVLGRISYLVSGQLNMWLVPKMLEDRPNGWGFGPRSTLLFAGLNAMFFVWSIFDLPEVKGRTAAEVDDLFMHNIKTRDFHRVSVA
ncbi:MFS sp general alpha glucoside:H+ symporter [Colletotrichum sojae]|uniref:MFS sp general alpha glucoside:H+ symporter n=1 Tax=Colletotrichum sojae TaxID=2175907 RepID=A0A8H6JQ81_9PEZI|nr:MFS sp general alpha glucoside:H+ symporter [Colletotrichum sojae]